MARNRLPHQTMPLENSTNANRPISGQIPTGPVEGSPSPASTSGTASPTVLSSAGEPGARRFRSQADGRGRRRFNTSQQTAARGSTSAAASQPAVEPTEENGNTSATADGATAQSAAQAQSTTAAPAGGTTPVPADPAKAAADEQRLREQIALASSGKQSQLDGLSDSTRNDLMTQLGGHRNMDYEGTHQADEASKDMAKQSDRWGKEV